jgi:catechol 2,3-dioxygenase-like lactoylglutathione lyase family enzyme
MPQEEQQPVLRDADPLVPASSLELPVQEDDGPDGTGRSTIGAVLRTIGDHMRDRRVLGGVLGHGGYLTPAATPADAGIGRNALKIASFDYTVLVVESLERALTFYVDVLGLELNHRSGPYAQLRTGATRLAMYERSAMEETLGMGLTAPAENAPGFELGFFVTNVDNAYAELVISGATAVTPPADRAWGQRTAYVRDPDGNLIELVEPTR